MTTFAWCILYNLSRVSRLSAVLLLVFSGLAQGDANWQTDPAKEGQQALQSGKPMLLYFTGSDW